MTEYQILRSDRQTVCIQLTREGQVLVRAPKRCPKRYIEEFVRSKEGWILRHQRVLQERRELREAFSLEEGQLLRLWGRELTVSIVPGQGPEILGNRLMLPTGDMELLRGPLRALIGENALPWLENRIARWEKAMGLSCRELKMSTARCRWGSCSRDGVIRISIYLFGAPVEAIDYVLMHELAHRRYFDHSRDFWGLVGAYCPDYPARRRALLQYQREPFLQSLAK